jgi:hypothetical protein
VKGYCGDGEEMISVDVEEEDTSNVLFVMCVIFQKGVDVQVEMGDV